MFSACIEPIMGLPASMPIGNRPARGEPSANTMRAFVPEGLIAMGDGRALEQVVVNLVDNAVKYTAAGQVTVAAEVDRDRVRLTVTDTGPGIEPQHLKRLFERFYRIDQGRSRDQGGTGLGLAIAKHLVQGMGGEIDVESGASGTRFTVRLPVSTPAR